MNTRSKQTKLFILTLGLLTAVAALTVDLSLPAIPAMVETLATDLSRGQQIVGIFMFGMALGQIPSGLAADRFGRLPTLYVGMLIFSLAASTSAVANDMNLILIARFVQGFGAASAIVVSRAIVRDIASGQEAARLMSLLTMIFTAAPVIAPSIGALLIAEWGWRAPFIAIAVCGWLMILGIRKNLTETHLAESSERPMRQLISSVRGFFSFRQSVFALLLLVLPPAGFMSVIAVSAALTTKIYDYSLEQYGYIFALAGLSIFAGSFVNRYLVSRFAVMTLIRIGIILTAIVAAQLVTIVWLNAAPFEWVWFTVCLFMFTIAILMANATVLALDPLPKIAGVASSIIGTAQNTAGALGALIAAFIYDGSVRNAVVIMAFASTTTTVLFLLRPLFVPGSMVHHPEELARD